MKRTNATRKSSDRVGQSSMTRFLRPHASPATTPSLSGSLTSLHDSSEEDDLVALDSLIKTRRPTIQAAPRQREVKRTEPSSPPEKVPLFAGSFNLHALLADRTARLAEKSTIERLEAKHTPEATEGRTSDGGHGNHVSDRVQALLKKDSEEVTQYWSTVKREVVLRDRRCPPRLRKALPRDLVPRHAHAARTEEICFCIRVQQYELDAEEIDFFGHLLESANTERDVEILKEILHDAVAPLQPAFTWLQDLAGHDQGSKVTQVGHDECCTTDLPAAVDELRLCKIRAIMQLMIDAISRKKSDESAELWHEVVHFATLLQLDTRYGHILAPEIYTLQLQVASRSTGPSLQHYTTISRITKDLTFQLQIVQSLPMADAASIIRTQTMAAAFFLDLSSESLDSIRDTGERLEAIISYLENSTPFHPLDERTSYHDMKRKITLLSFATTSIPPALATLTRQLIEVLQALHGRIVDSKAAFITRSEAKASIQRLADRIKYTLESQKRKNSIFEHLK